MSPEDEKKQCAEIEDEEKWNRAFKEYKTLREDVRSRESSTMLVGSILAFISFIIFSNTAINPPKSIYVICVLMFASLGLYFIWIVFYYTSQRLDDLYLEKMKKCLEPKLCFKLRQQIHNEIKCDCWFKLRHTFWYWTYGFLFLVWMFFLLALQL